MTAATPPAAAAAEAATAAHWLDLASSRLSWCDSYSRAEALVELAFQLPDAQWHRVLGKNWSTCDNLGVYRTRLRKLLPDTGPVRPMMTPDEQAAYDALPEQVTIYRGCGPVNKQGASWSLDRRVAERFPFLMRYRTPRPLLITATVRKSQVLALKLDRGEAEVITFGAQVLSVEPATQPGVQ